MLEKAQSPLEDPEHDFNTDPNEDKITQGTEGMSVQDVRREQEHVILLGGDGILVGGDTGTVGVSGNVPGGEEKDETFEGLEEGYLRGQEEEEEVPFISAGLRQGEEVPVTSVSDRGVEEFTVLERVEKQESVRTVEVGDEENLAAVRGEELENARAEDTEEGGEEDNVRAEETEEEEGEEISDED